MQKKKKKNRVTSSEMTAKPVATEMSEKCNIMGEGFHFIYLAFGFSYAGNLSAQCMG